MPTPSHAKLDDTIAARVKALRREVCPAPWSPKRTKHRGAGAIQRIVQQEYPERQITVSAISDIIKDRTYRHVK